ncbi:MAG: ABC transporter substrate-binding protein, partial [Myxococcaceae bacterium]
MKQVTYLAVSAVLALTGCHKSCSDESTDDAGVADAGPRELSEKEPNNKPEDALVLDSNSLVLATLGSDPSKMDEDWYALTATNPSSADVTVGGIPGTDVVLEIFDTDRNRLMAVNSQGEGKSERIPNLAVRGKLFVRVAATKKGNGGSYTLAALF